MGGTMVILLFCLEETQNLLNGIKYFGEGSFNVTTVPFKQLYVILEDFFSTPNTTDVISIFYVLMIDKKGYTFGFV